MYALQAIPFPSTTPSSTAWEQGAVASARVAVMCHQDELHQHVSSSSLIMAEKKAGRTFSPVLMIIKTTYIPGS
jgi:hypothetical protein